jgi:DNA-binding IclR family transcriptional regulator
MMERKYWVPALERAHLVLQCIAEQPSKLRLIDLTTVTSINKSTMFSLLQTMESLDWVNREKGDTYTLGSAFAYLGNAYFSGISLVELFMHKSNEAIRNMGETVQLARLEGTEIIYLAKKEAPTQVRLLSEPGMRIPAYAAAMGKILLSYLDDEVVSRMFADSTFKAYTPNTIQSIPELLEKLSRIRKDGYASDDEEVALGFSCIAAPVRNRDGNAVAAVSFTMSTPQWLVKREQATVEIQRLARELSDAL